MSEPPLFSMPRPQLQAASLAALDALESHCPTRDHVRLVLLHLTAASLHGCTASDVDRFLDQMRQLIREVS